MSRKGFTLVEVSLVVVLTVLVFSAFIASVGPALSNQRYNDSVQNFAEILRSNYSAVINVQSSGAGSSNQAIYGRLITFGEKDSADTIRSYDIVGKALDSENLGSSGQGIIAALKKVEATVFSERDTDKCAIYNEESYKLSYGAWLETTTPREDGAGEGEKFTGSILIVRSPVSGVVTTLYSKKIIEVKELQQKNSCNISLLDEFESSPEYSLKTEEIDFCVASDDQAKRDIRRNVRIAAAGSNASAVQIIAQDSENNKCKQS